MSGGGNNATIAYPGPDWEMLWPDSFGDFQLDIVGFLAILGEGSVAITAQVAALSNLFYLPRLIPAPQALLMPARKATLESVKANVTGVHSGNVKDHLNHVGDILLGGDMPPYTVRCFEVTKKPGVDLKRTPTLLARWFKGQPSKSKKNNASKNGMPNGNDKNADTSKEEEQPAVTARATGPLTYVAVLGCVFSIALFAASIVFGDGMSMLATILLSLLSSLVGVANKWTLKLAKPASDDKNSDAVIRYPNGSYLVVKCSEAVARELFFAPEEIEYAVRKTSTYRLIALLGTLMLMLGVIALANARLELQFAWAGAYILINAAQWVVAALPPRLHWDLSCYEVTEQTMYDSPSTCKNFTQALAMAVVFAGSEEWVRQDTGAMPGTWEWEEWLGQLAKGIKDLEPLSDKPVIDEDADPERAKPVKRSWSKLSESMLSKLHLRHSPGCVHSMPEGWHGDGAKDIWNAIKKSREKLHPAAPKPQQQNGTQDTSATAGAERTTQVTFRTAMPKTS